MALGVAKANAGDTNIKARNAKINFMHKSIPYVLAAALLAFGISFSIWDYKNWWKIEHERYGQGPQEGQGLSPAGNLVGPYASSLGKFRLRAPENWDRIATKEGLRFRHPFAQRGIYPTIEASFEKAELDLPQTTDREAKKHTLTQELDYINTDTTSMVVLTWTDGELTKQLAMAIKNDRLVKIQASCLTSEWKIYANTFWEVYRSLVLF